ncbi:hypothetical protein KQI84_00480 [bacterium]|nr:hypothetical protein [bacterium]
MAKLQPGKQIPDSKAVPKELLAEDSWGEIWRAEHDKHGTVILVAFTTPKGAEMLMDGRDGLVNWNKMAGAEVPQLARVLHVSPTEPLPHLLVEDPGGRTLRAALPDMIDNPVSQGSWAYSIVRGLHQADVYEMAPVGITPDNLIHCPGSQEAPWKIIPIAPRSLLASRTIAGGRYHAKELDTSGKPHDIHADLYSFSWLWLELQAGNFNIPHEPNALKQFVPHKRLATVIANNLQSRNGEFSEPRLAELGVQRWVKHDIKEDLKEFKEKTDAAKRSNFQQYMFENRKWLIQIGLSLFIIICVLLSVLAVKGLFTTSGSRDTPYGIMTLYLDEFVGQRDVTGAQAYTTGQATTQTERLFAEIEDMEQNGKASHMTEAMPVVRGSGNARTVKVDFKGVNNDVFMIAEMNIRANDRGQWVIEEIYYKNKRDYDKDKEATREMGQEGQ